MFDAIIINPLTNLLLGFYQLFGNNLGWAIVFFTIALRVVLLPLTIQQIKQQKRMAELQPRLQELQSNRKDPTKMTPKEAELMKQTGTSCLGGCLPLLIQLPILIGLNTVINNISTVNGDPAKGGDFFNNILYFDFLKHSTDYLFNTKFAGLDLAVIPSSITNWDLLPYAVLILLLVITQFIQTSLMYYAQNKAQKKSDKKSKPNAKKKTKEQEEQEQIAEQSKKLMEWQIKYMMPILVGFGAYSLHTALGVYWLMQNLLAIIQTDIQYRLQDKRFGLQYYLEDVREFGNKTLKRLQSSGKPK